MSSNRHAAINSYRLAMSGRASRFVYTSAPGFGDAIELLAEDKNRIAVSFHWVDADVSIATDPLAVNPEALQLTQSSTPIEFFAEGHGPLCQSAWYVLPAFGANIAVIETFLEY